MRTLLWDTKESSRCKVICDRDYAEDILSFAVVPGVVSMCQQISRRVTLGGAAPLHYAALSSSVSDVKSFCTSHPLVALSSTDGSLSIVKIPN